MKRLLTLLLGLSILASCSRETGSEFKAVTGPDDLKGHTLACLAGSLCDLQFDEYARGAIKQIYNSEPDMLVALDSRKTDYLVLDSVFIVSIDKKIHPVEIAYVEPYVGGDIGAAFRKTDTELCGQFNDFLAQIKSDGTYDAMLDRWISDKVSVSEMPEIKKYTEGAPIKVGCLLGLPFCFVKNGAYAGMEVELIERFGEYVQRPIEISLFEFSSMMAALKTGVIDIWCSFITINEERAREVLFSDSYFTCNAAVFQRVRREEEAKDPFYIRICRSFNNNLIVEDRWKMLVDGLWETIIISLFSLILGTLLGGVICFLRMSKNKFLSGFARVYVEILRGVPMLVFLMVMFYVVLASSGISGRWVAIISFAINFSAYCCEIFRTGISSVDRGQTEAGIAMGFSRTGTFLNFVLPQAVKNVLPVFKNEAVSLVKGTSIVGYVAIQDLTKISDIIRSRTFDAFFPLIIVAIIYFILAWLFGKALDCMAKKLS